MTRGYDNAVTALESPCIASRMLTRRRGAALESAILDAAVAELTGVGYAAFSVEAVAARARTGKASIYRRWPTKQLLVMDCLETVLPGLEDCGIPPEFDDTVTTVEALHQVARAITAVLASPAGDAMRTVKCEAAGDRELAELIEERFQAPRRAAMITLLRRGVERGEVRPGAATELVADVVPAMLVHRVIMRDEPITEQAIVEIMADVMIPLIEAR